MDYKEINEKMGPFVRISLSLPVLSGLGGSTLAQAYSEWDSSRRYEKLKSFIEEIRDRVRCLENNRNAIKYNDEDCAILDNVLQKIQIEHSEKKREYYASFLISALSNVGRFDKKQRFIRAIDEFTESHFRVLSFLYNIAPNTYPTVKDIQEQLHIENRKSELYPILADLCGTFAYVERSWTLAPESKACVLSTQNLSPENLAGNCQHKITDLGKEFYQYIFCGTL